MKHEIGKTIVSRRAALSLFGLPAVVGLTAVALGLGEAAAQTAGMTRRENRRSTRHNRRTERRTGKPAAATPPK
jgi:hypothetical protein